MTDTGHRPATPRSDLPSPFADGAAVGIGSLPHRDAQEATEFAISEFEIAFMQ